MSLKLFEREESLSQLRGLATAAERNVGHVVVITGEAGADKTSLTRVFCDDVSSKMRCLRGACEDLAIAEPLGPLHDLMAGAGVALRAIDPAKRQRIALFNRSLTLFSEAERPTLVLIEDIHWADDATLDFVKFLARRVHDHPILLVLTSRDEEEEGRQQLRRALSSVPRDDTTRIALHPLSLTAIQEMSGLSESEAARIHRVSGGNAFFVSELLSGGTSASLANVHDAVLARADKLNPAERRILDMASIFPRRAERNLVLTLAQCNQPESALHGAVAKGLLHEDGQFVAFRHEVARQAVESSLPMAVRQDLNARLFATIDDRPDVPKSRKLHHARAASDDTAVRLYAPLAGQDAFQADAFLQASEYYELAIASADSKNIQTLCDLSIHAAESCQNAALLKKALKHAERAQKLLGPDGDVLLRGRILALLAGIAWELGLKGRAASLGDEAIETLKETASEELAEALAVRGRQAMADYDHALAVSLCERAEALARKFGRNDILAHALASRCVCYTYEDNTADALGEAGIRIAMEDQHHLNIARCLSNYAFALMFALKYHKALELCEASIAHSLRHEALHGIEFAQAGRLLLLGKLGRWPELKTGLDEMFESDVQQSSAFLTIRFLRARMDTRLGHPVLEQRITKILDLAANEDMRHIGEVACLLAERAWLGLEDRSRALAWLDRGLASHKQNRRAQDMLFWRHRIAPAREDQWIKGVDPAYAFWLRDDWREAAKGFKALGASYYEALALLSGDEAAANQGVSILRNLGANAVEGKAILDLKQRGISIKPLPRPRISTESNPAGLTRRQMDVLALLNQGLTNAAIGDRLFISPKTVDHHVSAIIDKFGVASRGEAAALAREAGLV